MQIANASLHCIFVINDLVAQLASGAIGQQQGATAVLQTMPPLRGHLRILKILIPDMRFILEDTANMMPMDDANG